MRIKLTVSYCGAGFCGWQSQPSRRTVQGEMEGALCRLFGVPVAATAAGRTDEGVHAVGQVVHFDAPGDLSCARIAGALNAFLPPAIRVLQAEPTDETFHARKSAHRKTYVYRLYTGSADHPLLTDRALRLPAPPDFDAMRQAAPLFAGRHDFAAFRALGSSANTTVRTVFDCTFTPPRLIDELLPPLAELRITADGFLYKMVRLIVGALLQVGKGNLGQEQLAALLSGTADWQKLTAPACGLYLLSVCY